MVLEGGSRAPPAAGVRARRQAVSVSVGVGDVVAHQRALAIHADTLKYIKKILQPGLSEKSVFSGIEKYVKARGVGFSFPPIVASGPHSSYPHAILTERQIKKNDVVLVDMGIDYFGYKSDLTRMFLLGKIPKLIQHVMNEVREAQRQAISKIQPGIPACEVDAQARNYLKKKKLAKYFGHSLGHGVGLEIHEAPRLSVKDSTILKEGMVVTVEPGVYLAHRFGIRIEDMVLVTKNGYQILSGYIN